MKKKELKRRIDKLHFYIEALHAKTNKLEQLVNELREYADGFDDFFNNPEPKENTNQGGIK